MACKLSGRRIPSGARHTTFPFARFQSVDILAVQDAYLATSALRYIAYTSVPSQARTRMQGREVERQCVSIRPGPDEEQRRRARRLE
jgi:hypothetical protein